MADQPDWTNAVAPVATAAVALTATYPAAAFANYNVPVDLSIWSSVSLILAPINTAALVIYRWLDPTGAYVIKQGVLYAGVNTTGINWTTVVRSSRLQLMLTAVDAVTKPTLTIIGSNQPVPADNMPTSGIYNGSLNQSFTVNQLVTIGAAQLGGNYFMEGIVSSGGKGIFGYEYTDAGGTVQFIGLCDTGEAHLDPQGSNTIYKFVNVIPGVVNPSFISGTAGALIIQFKLTPTDGSVQI